MPISDTVIPGTIEEEVLLKVVEIMVEKNLQFVCSGRIARDFPTKNSRSVQGAVERLVQKGKLIRVNKGIYSLEKK